MESADYWRGREDQIAKMRDDGKRSALVAYGLIILIAPIAFWIIPSHFEAKTYSKLTGADVSTWDAMWVELRVQEAIPGDRRVQ